ncbi:outer membrane beta-barrel protein [Devosia sp.]|uniref:outer membrane beta-barrel protein n=1 Tax=Devosia sp. TaxID=1871048 RepID=UPI003A93D39D
MTRSALLGGVALFALSMPALAADLIIDTPAPMAMAPAHETGVYAEFLGGAALPATMIYDTDDEYDYAAGWAVAGVLGFATGIDGLSLEGDLFYASRDSSPDENDEYNVTTASAMAALKYTVDLNDTFSVYGAVGLGGVYLRDEEIGGAVEAEGWGAGYLLKAGVTAQVADAVSLVGEIRHVESFERIDDEQIGTTSVLAGVKFDF